MGGIDGFRMSHMGWLGLSVSRGSHCRPTLSPTYSWAVRLATRLVALLFCGIRVLAGQLTTGTVEGVLRDTNGQLRSNSQIVVTGGAGFRVVIRTNSRGEFVLTLPYGRYE